MTKIKHDWECTPHKVLYYRETVDGKRTWKRVDGKFYCVKNGVIVDIRQYWES